MCENEGDNLHCSPLDRPYKAHILAYYPETVHGAHFDADAVCMVSMLCMSVFFKIFFIRSFVTQAATRTG